MIRKRWVVVGATAILVIGCLVIIAYSRTWGKTDIECKIHINEQLVLESVYGESPSFAIWIENPENGMMKTIFVTSRAGLNDWEGKTEVPVALPAWDEINEKEKELLEQGEYDIHEIDAVTGKRCYIMALPMKLKADSGQARVVAFA